MVLRYPRPSPNLFAHLLPSPSPPPSPSSSPSPGMELPAALSDAAALPSPAERKELLAALPGPPQRALQELEKATSAKSTVPNPSPNPERRPDPTAPPSPSP